MFRQSAGTKIAGETIFQNHAPVGQRVRKREIVHHADAVADPLRAQQFEGFAYIFRAAGFASMANQAQAFVAREIERGPEVGGRQRKLRQIPNTQIERN